MRNIFRKLLVLFFINALPFIGFSQHSALSKDQKTLLSESLFRALYTDKSLPDYALLENKTMIILLDKMVSETNMEAPPVFLKREDLPLFKTVHLNLMSEEAINAMKPKKKDLLFIRLAAIDIPDSEYAFVTIFGQWKLGKESLKKGFRYKPSNGYSLLFKRNESGWEYQKSFNERVNWMNLPQ